MLRKGCSDTCILRPCLQWIESSDAQGYATVFVAKFFGRAGLMGLISAVPDNQRPALFQSLLYEACGRTVNPVFGAVGLLWNGNWQICQAAVDTVLKGGQLRPRSPSSCFPADLSSSAPYSPAFAISGNLPIPLVGRVDDPTQMTAVPFSSNASADVLLDRDTMNLGVELPAAKSLELEERGTNVHRNSNDWHQEVVNEEMCSIWQKDVKQCDSWNGLNTYVESRRDGLGQGSLQLENLAYAAPRRVRARTDATSVPPNSGERMHEEPVGGGEQLELDLTLKVGDKMVGSKRLSSPCDSVNSEGSITSLDTTLREPSKLPSWALGTTQTPQPFRKLLPLLH